MAQDVQNSRCRSEGFKSVCRQAEGSGFFGGWGCSGRNLEGFPAQVLPFIFQDPPFFLSILRNTLFRVRRRLAMESGVQDQRPNGQQT